DGESFRTAGGLLLAHLPAAEEMMKDRAVRLVVIDRQDTHILQLAWAGLRHASAGLLLVARREPERRALARFARHADFASHAGHELLADGQSQSRSAKAA